MPTNKRPSSCSILLGLGPLSAASCRISTTLPQQGCIKHQDPCIANRNQREHRYVMISLRWMWHVAPGSFPSVHDQSLKGVEKPVITPLAEGPEGQSCVFSTFHALSTSTSSLRCVQCCISCFKRIDYTLSVASKPAGTVALTYFCLQVPPYGR